MSLREPLRVGSDPDRDPPETLLEVTVTIEHRRDLSPEQMREVAETVYDRLDVAIDESNFADLPLEDVHVDLDWRNARTSPLYPLRLAGEVHTCRLDLVERLELLAQEAGLGHAAVDAAGRAYDVHVDVSFSRLPDDRAETGAPPESSG